MKNANKKCLFIGNFYTEDIINKYKDKYKLLLANDNYEKNFIKILKTMYKTVICFSFPAIPFSNKDPVSLDEKIYHQDNLKIIIPKFTYTRTAQLFKRNKNINCKVLETLRSNPDIDTVFVSTYNQFCCIKPIKQQFKNKKVVLLLPDQPTVFYDKKLNLYKIRMHILNHKMEKEMKLVDICMPITKYQMEFYKHKPKQIYVYESYFDIALFDNLKKDKTNTILYAGSLKKDYGIDDMLNSFLESNAKDNYKLVICGDGECKEMVVDYAKRNSSIVYLGTLRHDEILKLEINSSALLIPDRNDRKYSFHSKYIEYLASGTTTISYIPKGMKEEYQPLIFSIEKNGGSIKNALNKMADMPFKEFDEIGQKAKQYIEQNKNISKFANEITNLINNNQSNKYH